MVIAELSSDGFFITVVSMPSPLLPHQRSQDFLLCPFAMHNEMLPPGLSLCVVLRLFASLEPRHDAVLQLTLDDRSADASTAAVGLSTAGSVKLEVSVISFIA
jgi:hypothetical protein